MLPTSPPWWRGTLPKADRPRSEAG